MGKGREAQPWRPAPPNAASVGLRVCGAAKRWLLLKVWQIPTTAPKPPREARPIPGRSWVIFLRGVWLFGCLAVYLQGQPDAQKAAGLCRA